ncbi:hypothetical protein L7F22_019234 [Adiantum nelumboides]|nr:hypothetical protein [Adiantum nelumboides]
MNNSDQPCWIGIDGTRSGWSVCVIEANGKVQLRVIEELEEIWDYRDPRYILSIGIDMPLALSSKAERGGRKCEREARRILAAAKKRAITFLSKKKASMLEGEDYLGPTDKEPFVGPSSIFTPPSRPALDIFERGGTHKEVSEANKKSAFDIRDTALHDNDEERVRKRQKTKSEESGFGLSVQTYNIMEKILELDKFVTNGIKKDRLRFLPPTQEEEEEEQSNCKTYLFERHPELAFLSSQANFEESQIENQQAINVKKCRLGRIQRLDLLKNLEPFKDYETKQEFIEGLFCGSQENAKTMKWITYLLRGRLTNHIREGARPYFFGDTKAIPSDDVIDAMICAVNAKRFHFGNVIEVGGPSTEGGRELDFRGIPMSIFV